MGDCNCKDLKSRLVRLEDLLNQQQLVTEALASGHPVWILDEPSDIAAFDTSTGWGSGVWSAWAIADGTTYTRNGVTVVTKDYQDRFPVGAGATYAVGDTGGTASETLTVAQLPSVTVALTDPGHNHNHTDPGHTHGITETPHTHPASQAAHTHTFTTDSSGTHTHALASGAFVVSGDNQGLFLDGVSGASEVSDTDSIAEAGAHTHTGTTASATPIITVTAASTNVSTQTAFTGMINVSNTTGITAAPFGGDEAHNNLPPYLGVLFVQRIA